MINEYIELMAISMAISIVVLWGFADVGAFMRRKINYSFQKKIDAEEYILIKSNNTWILYDDVSDDYIGKSVYTFLFKYYSKKGGVIYRYSKLAKSINKKLKMLEGHSAVPLSENMIE